MRTKAIATGFALILTACGVASEGADSQPDSASSTGGTPDPALQVASGQPTTPWPEARLHPTLLHDPNIETMVMLGGLSKMQRSIDMRDMWSLQTSDLSWSPLGETEPRDVLINIGMDVESKRIVALNMAPSQTWAYDAAARTWEQRRPAEHPESSSKNPRFGAPLTYDTESDRLILFAGGSPWHMYADTWAYDYNTDSWEQMNPPVSPSPRAMYNTAYDAESDRVLLWGGFTGTDENDVAMWAYDYNTDSWEALENQQGPQQHWERHGMAYIPENDRVLFYSGMLEDEGVLPAETWYYDYNTNTWTEVTVATSPPDLAMYAMAYDPASANVVLFSGETVSKYAGSLSRDIWVFDPTKDDWSRIAAPSPNEP